MDIEEIQTKRLELAKHLAELIIRFEKETTVTVYSIRLSRLEFSDGSNLLGAIDIEIRL